MIVSGLITLAALALALWLARSRAVLRRKLDETLAAHGEASEQLAHAEVMRVAAETLHSEAEVFSAQLETIRVKMETRLAEADFTAKKILAEANQTASEELVTKTRNELLAGMEAVYATKMDEVDALKAELQDEKRKADTEINAAKAVLVTAGNNVIAKTRAQSAAIIVQAREQADAIEEAARVRAHEQGYRPYGVGELERARVANAALSDDLFNARADVARLTDETAMLRGKLRILSSKDADDEWWKDRHHKLAEALDTAERQISALSKTANEATVLREALAKVADRLVRVSRTAALSDLTDSNLSATLRRMEDLFAFLAKHSVIAENPEAAYAEIRQRFHQLARAAAAREEQKRIKAMMREELALQREREAELKRLEAQEQAVRRALDTALARAKAEHSEEVDRLRVRLAELDGAIVRAKSQAELTKAGHVYVLSNIGSFGEGVFKVGMTRRLEPLERVMELGDASVPFPFDVHMLIACEDAPALENALHRALNAHRLNKVNLRKEFFRTEIAELSRLVEAAHGKVEYVADPAALQYRDSQSMTDADFAFVATEQSAALAEDLSEN